MKWYEVFFFIGILIIKKICRGRERERDNDREIENKEGWRERGVCGGKWYEGRVFILDLIRELS